MKKQTYVLSIKSFSENTGVAVFFLLVGIFISNALLWLGFPPGFTGALCFYIGAAIISKIYEDTAREENEADGSNEKQNVGD